MDNSKLEWLKSKTSSEVEFVELKTWGCCASEMPLRRLWLTSSLWMNSLGNVPQTLGPVNDNISRPGSMISFGLAEHQYFGALSYCCILSHIMEVGRGLFSSWIQAPEIWVLVKRGLAHVCICPLPDFFCAYSWPIPHLPLLIEQDQWSYPPFENTLRSMGRNLHC